MLKKKIVFIFLFISLVGIVSSEPLVNLGNSESDIPTVKLGKVKDYCSTDGFTIEGNLIVIGNVTFNSTTINMTVVNYNVTGTLTLDGNLSVDNIDLGGAIFMPSDGFVVRSGSSVRMNITTGGDIYTAGEWDNDASITGNSLTVRYSRTLPYLLTTINREGLVIYDGTVGDNVMINMTDDGNYIGVGNVTADYIFANISQATGLTSSQIPNIFNQSLNTSDNVKFNNINASGNITAGGSLKVGGIDTSHNHTFIVGDNGIGGSMEWNMGSFLYMGVYPTPELYATSLLGLGAIRNGLYLRGLTINPKLVFGNATFGNTAQIEYIRATDAISNTGATSYSFDNKVNIGNWRNYPFAGSNYIDQLVGTTYFRMGAGLFNIMTLSPTEGIVLNEVGKPEYSTRIKGDTNDELFCVNASTDMVGVGTCKPATKLQVIGATRMGDATNYVNVNGQGDMSFVNSSGFYPRLLTQSARPANGAGVTQIQSGESLIWKDSDDSKVYHCFNDLATVKCGELI